MTNESTTLYFREGTSDKVYRAVLEEKTGGFVVNFAFGRRGSTMQTGTKTASPVSFEKAKIIYDKLVREKTAKGYTPGPDGTPYAHTDNEQRDTGLRCQLLNSITEAEAEKLLDDPGWWMQEKFDGKRMLIRKTKEVVEGVNRKGLIVALPEPILKAAQALPGSFIIDGEAVGDRFFAFDCLVSNGRDLRPLPYSKRMVVVMSLVSMIANGAIVYATTATTTSTQNKREMLNALKTLGREGVVFKDCDAPYTAGRPASGGTQLKFKFVATGSFIVAKVNAGKRSVALEVMDQAGKGIGVGNVTIPANQKVPGVGTIVEARYLYCYPNGSLFQQPSESHDLRTRPESGPACYH
ncbi:MAG: WGR domain-containing protein [Planctomycetota bacterium]|nr:WGR domain-containing protein [Planctomycetota bacterium]